MSVANASQHLQQLKRACLVASRRDGKFVLYQLADDNVLGLPGSLRQLAERNLAEVDRTVRGYFAQRDSMEPVSRTKLLERMRKGLVTVFDVRPADEFTLGHLPGAVNMPLSELEARPVELDPGVEIVAYRRGAYCVLSFEAVAALRARGFEVRRLGDGFPEWRTAGLVVETGFITRDRPKSGAWRTSRCRKTLEQQGPLKSLAVNSTPSSAMQTENRLGIDETLPPSPEPLTNCTRNSTRKRPQRIEL